MREALPGDIPGMMVVRAAVRENRLVSRVIGPADYLREMQAEGRGWVAADEAGRILGFAIGNARTGNIWALFVDPEHEGRGIGRALHDRMVEWLFSTGLTRLSLGTAPQTRAQQFYVKAGWTFLGLDQHGEALFEKLA